MVRRLLLSNGNDTVINKFHFEFSVVTRVIISVNMYFQDTLKTGSTFWQSGDYFKIYDGSGFSNYIPLPYSADLSNPSDSSSIALVEYLRGEFNDPYDSTSKHFSSSRNIWYLNFRINKPDWFVEIYNNGSLSMKEDFAPKVEELFL
ncbi:hypothetical protein [Seleniivibrio woodruffii]|uniref:hypothetical protein n=1 Tax=Seleniivibrio woodruffii TaxID=1078050 RepID=UPI0024091ED1|nr:hypothetical protein [Seleniivibrio woodruffii]